MALSGFGLLRYGSSGGVIASLGADGLIWPAAFSGVSLTTWVFPEPAVAGVSPFGPEGWALFSRRGLAWGGC